MPSLKTQVDHRIKDAVSSHARAACMSESDLLRAIVLDALCKHDKLPPILADNTNTEPKQINLSLASFLLAGVRERAKERAVSANRWIVCLIQSHLMRDSVMFQQEIDALRSSNRELAAIGRNLNQIARSLHENFHETDRIKLELLQALLESIKNNRHTIQALVCASQNAWDTTQ